MKNSSFGVNQVVSTAVFLLDILGDNSLLAISDF